MKINRIVLVIFVVFTKCTNSEYFSSTEELKRLKVNQRKFINTLKDLSDELEKSYSYVQRKITEIEDEHDMMNNNLDTYLHNPLKGFSLIKRLTYDIESLQKKLTSISGLSKKFDKIKIPMDEIDGAVEGIYRLQETYDLKTDHIARGILYDTKYSKDLLPSDLLVLAKEMLKYSHKYAAEYADVAKQLNKNYDNEMQFEFLEELFDFYNSTSNYKKALEVIDNILILDPKNSAYEDKRMNLELLSLYETPEVKNNDDRKNLLGSHYTKEKESLILSKGCQGKLKKSIKEMSQLHCRYVSKTDFTKIAPFKVAEANLDPYVAIYHDVISDNEIEILKTFASDGLRRASVMTVNTTTKVSRVRIAQLNWQEERAHEIYQRLTRRVHHMTGLNMETAELWQVQNYGIGGFYGPHHDFASKGQVFSGDTGNRIATTLFYLTDVEKGGGTVFPFLKLHVSPVKGTAAFWYNLHSSGERDYLTRHAACPVLYGSKWVANKWIRESAQEFYRPCVLEERTSDEKYYLKLFSLPDYDIHI